MQNTVTEKESLMRRLLAIALLFVLPCFAQAAKLPEKPATFVSDFAGVLTAGERAEVESFLADAQRRTGNTFLYVSFRELPGDLTIEECADALFEKWGIGDKDRNNGFLFLQITGDRQFRLHPGYGLEPSLTDAALTRVREDIIIPRFKENPPQFKAGILGAFQEAARIVETDQAQNNTPQQLAAQVEEAERGSRSPAQSHDEQVAAELASAQRSETMRLTLFLLTIAATLVVFVITIYRFWREFQRTRALRASIRRDAPAHQALLPTLHGDTTYLLERARGAFTLERDANYINDAISSLAARFATASADLGMALRLVQKDPDIAAEAFAKSREIVAYCAEVRSTLDLRAEAISTAALALAPRIQQGRDLHGEAYAKLSELIGLGFRIDRAPLAAAISNLVLFDQQRPTAPDPEELLRKVELEITAIEKTKTDAVALAALRASTLTTSSNTTDSLVSLRTSLAKAHAALDALRKEAPASRWKQEAKNVDSVASALETAEDTLADVVRRCGFDVQDIAGAANTLETLTTALAKSETAFSASHALLEHVRDAKTNIGRQRSSAQSAISTAATTCADSDVEHRAKSKLSSARTTFNDATATAAKNGLVDWIVICAAYVTAKTDANEATRLGKDDIDDAEDARARARARRNSSTSSIGFGGGGGGGSRPNFGGGRAGGGGVTGGY